MQRVNVDSGGQAALPYGMIFFWKIYPKRENALKELSFCQKGGIMRKNKDKRST